jgi:hypothetical protein
VFKYVTCSLLYGTCKTISYESLSPSALQVPGVAVGSEGVLFGATNTSYYYTTTGYGFLKKGAKAPTWGVSNSESYAMSAFCVNTNGTAAIVSLASSAAGTAVVSMSNGQPIPAPQIPAGFVASAAIFVEPLNMFVLAQSTAAPTAESTMIAVDATTFDVLWTETTGVAGLCYAFTYFVLVAPGTPFSTLGVFCVLSNPSSMVGFKVFNVTRAAAPTTTIWDLDGVTGAVVDSEDTVYLGLGDSIQARAGVQGDLLWVNNDTTLAQGIPIAVGPLQTLLVQAPATKSSATVLYALGKRAGYRSSWQPWLIWGLVLSAGLLSSCVGFCTRK